MVGAVGEADESLPAGRDVATAPIEDRVGLKLAHIDWSTEMGWHDARVTALEPLRLHPGAAVLHYGQEISEGLKVYRHPDGALRMFRPDMNAARFRRSAARLVLPELADALFLESIEQLVAVDADWVPAKAGHSLYLRPFLIATEPFLGVRPAAKACGTPGRVFATRGSD